MPKVSKLVSQKLENYFNDVRLEESFDTSIPKLKSGADKDLMELKYEYLFGHLVGAEREKRREYLRRYKEKRRKDMEKLLNSLGTIEDEEVNQNPTEEKNHESQDTTGNKDVTLDISLPSDINDDIRVENGRAKTKTDGEPIGTKTKSHNDRECDAKSTKSKLKARKYDEKSFKSMQSRRSAFIDAGSNAAYSQASEKKIPVTRGKITPNLLDFPRRKVMFSEADRLVGYADEVFTQSELKQIDRIYGCGENHYGVLPPIVNNKQDIKKKTQNGDIFESENKQKQTTRNRPRTHRRFRLALHQGTILKAPKLCQDVERILAWSECRKKGDSESVSSDSESEYRSAVDLEGNFKEPMPKGAGDCSHLSLLLGVQDEEEDLISERTSSISLGPTGAAIIEVDQQVELDNDEVFPPPESYSYISGSRASVKESEYEPDFSRASNAASDDEKGSEKEGTAEKDGQTDENVGDVVSSSATETKKESSEKEKDGAETDSQSSKSSSNDTVIAENDDQQNIHGSVNEARQTDETGKNAETVLNMDEKTKSGDSLDMRQDSPIYASERGTPFTVERNEADIDTPIHDDQSESKKLSKLSRKERDERNPNLFGSSTTTTSSSSSRRSSEGKSGSVPVREEEKAGRSSDDTKANLFEAINQDFSEDAQREKRNEVDWVDNSRTENGPEKEAKANESNDDEYKLSDNINKMFNTEENEDWENEMNSNVFSYIK